jgi:predicted GNAT superfamily acetyltransferase
LDSSRVKAVLDNQPADRAPIEARISVPSNIGKLREKEPAKAREIQLRISEEFREAFDKNLAVTGFERTEDAGTYLLGPWQFS